MRYKYGTFNNKRRFALSKVTLFVSVLQPGLAQSSPVGVKIAQSTLETYAVRQLSSNYLATGKKYVGSGGPLTIA